MGTAEWEARFAGAGYVYGTEPAGFVARWAHLLPAGARVLSVAEGEGRNAVHLALRGARVTAVDGAAAALAKARRLAAARGATVAFHQADLAGWDWPLAAFDAVLGVFIQFAPPDLRGRIFAGIDRALAPGGLLLLHGYAPRQLGYGTGGPGRAENLWTLDLLAAAFPGYAVIRAADYDAEIAEGTGHRGRSALIDFIARKPG